MIRPAMAAAPKVFVVPTLSHPGGSPPVLSAAMILEVKLSPEISAVKSSLPDTP